MCFCSRWWLRFNSRVDASRSNMWTSFSAPHPFNRRVLQFPSNKEICWTMLQKDIFKDTYAVRPQMTNPNTRKVNAVVLHFRIVKTMVLLTLIGNEKKSVVWGLQRVLKVGSIGASGLFEPYLPQRGNVSPMSRLSWRARVWMFSFQSPASLPNGKMNSSLSKEALMRLITTMAEGLGAEWCFTSQHLVLVLLCLVGLWPHKWGRNVVILRITIVD